MRLMMNRTCAAGLSLLLCISPVGPTAGEAFAQPADGISSLNHLFQKKANAANDEAVVGAEAGREAQRQQQRLREEQQALEAQRARTLSRQVTTNGASNAPPCPGCVLDAPAPSTEHNDKP